MSQHQQQPDNNFFDNLEVFPVDSNKKHDPVWDRIDNLIHQVFAQNEKGAELLAIWQKALIMAPTVTPNSTQFQAGIAEGNKEFIRNILLTIQKVEIQ